MNYFRQFARWTFTILTLGVFGMSFGLGLAGWAEPAPSPAEQKVLLQEYKPSQHLEVGVHQSRLFSTDPFLIIRTSTSDPAIAEPIVVAENQVVILGKKAGPANVIIWGMDASHREAVVNISALVKNDLAGAARLKVGSDLHMKQDQRPQAIDFSNLDSSLNTGGIGGGAFPIPKTLPDVIAPKHFNTNITVKINKWQSRAFRTRHRIMKIWISNRAIGMPVVVSQHEMVVYGTNAGAAKMAITDQAQNVIGIDLFVSNKPEATWQSTGNAGSFLAPVPIDKLILEEPKIDKIVSLQIGQWKTFRLKQRLIRDHLSDGAIADVQITADKEVQLIGTKAGKATWFIWDEAGNRLCLEVVVCAAKSSGKNATVKLPEFGASEPARKKVAPQASETAEPGMQVRDSDSAERVEIEHWVGEKKWVWSVPVKP